MPEMPAFCDNCGTVFGSGYVFENCQKVSLSGNTVGPCPARGGNGHVPDGIYNITGKAIRLITGTAKTINDLNRLAQILKNAQKTNQSQEQIESTINDELPELHSLASILPKTRNELYAFIAIILTAIGLLVGSISALKDEQVPEYEVEEIIEKSFNETIVKSSNNIEIKQETSKTIRKKKKIGRNEQCPCGSGKKYKKCCL